MRYYILSGKTTQELEIQVNQYTLNDWELYGNMFVDHDRVFYQCVTKRIPKDGKPVAVIEEHPYGSDVKAVTVASASRFIGDD